MLMSLALRGTLIVSAEYHLESCCCRERNMLQGTGVTSREGLTVRRSGGHFSCNECIDNGRQ